MTETWQESFKKSLKSIEQVNQFFGTNLPELPYEILIPPSLAKRIKENGLDSVLAKQFLPSAEEVMSSQEIGLKDPIGDQNFAKQGQLIHRYKNRVLFLPTTICPVICRYCFRKNELSEKDEIFKANFEKTKSYLNNHQEIEEIIFSGGDPLMLSNSKIEFFLEEFSKIPHLRYIRFHTKAPVSLPNRVDQGLLKILERFTHHFETLSLGIHINHSEEIDEQVESSLLKLRDIQRLQLLSQTVLLKNVNDCPHILENLFKDINKLGVRPYYLHHPDKVRGGMHFQVDIPVGRKIFASLRNNLPGWMIPQYVLDIPQGHGKTPIYNPEQIEFKGFLMDLNQDKVKL